MGGVIQVGYDASKEEHMPNAVNIDDKGFYVCTSSSSG
jgi:hypothetical protein